MFCYLLTLLILLTIAVQGKLVSVEPAKQSSECSVHNNIPLHDVMDRICEMCHEFSSHSKPNMRAECRADCFTTDTFRSCLKLFTPKRHTRHSRRHSAV